MKTIVVRTQKELDALPDSFTEYTVIEIRSTTERVYINKAWENSRVVARGNSSIAAYRDWETLEIGRAHV